MLSLFSLIIKSLFMDTHLWRGALGPYSSGTLGGCLHFLKLFLLIYLIILYIKIKL